MKKLFSIISFVLMVCFLTGCANKMPYEIVKEDGEYYLVFDEEKYSHDDSERCGITYFTTFENIEAMKNGLLYGQMSEKQLEQVSMFRRDEQGRVEIPDLDNLWDITYPDGSELHFVYLQDDRYALNVKAEGMGYFFVNETTQKQFDEEMSYIDSWPEEDEEWLEEQYLDTQSGAMVYHHIDSVGNKRIMYVYTIIDGEKTICVREEYRLEESETLPFYVNVAIGEKGRYVDIYINDISQAPTVEWISQFGICDYE